MTRVMRDPDEIGAYVDMLRRNRISCGLVPTMGALHAGHAALIRRSVAACDRTVVSIYVNPLQFGAGEDFERYPRALDDDVALCGRENADIVFAPAVRDMQPPGHTTTVSVAGVTEDFEGARRPGHFDGVATVVARLLNVVRPDRAYFGQKDYQQTVVIRRMVRDLGVPVEIVVVPIVRDADGLALSSRNRYLSAEDREEALRLPRALVAAERRILEGETAGDAVRAFLAAALESPRADVEAEYADLVDPDTLVSIRTLAGHAVLLAALRVAWTRLLDNRIVAPPGTPAWER